MTSARKSDEENARTHQALMVELERAKQELRQKVREVEFVQQELKAANAYVETIVDAVREPLLILDENFQIESANRAFYSTFQLDRQDVENQSLYEITDGQWNIPELRTLIGQVIASGESFNGFPVKQEFPNIGIKFMLISARRLPHLPLLLLSIEDITERRLATDSLHQSQERYRLLVENAIEYAIFTMDVEGRIITWNPGAERILGWTEEEAKGRSGEIIFTDTDKAQGRFQKELKGAMKNEAANDERWHRRKDGSKFWATGMMYPLRAHPDHDGTGDENDGKLHGFAKLLRDDTERRQAELALQESEERLRSLSENLEQQVVVRAKQIRGLVSQLSLVEEQERQRLSQILHDDLQQQLFGIQMKLKLVQNDLKDGHVETLPDELEAAGEWILQCISLTRQLSADLSPPIMEDEGLTVALSWLIIQMQKNHKLEVQLVAEHSFCMDNREKFLLLFRIVRELLFNVVKHAGVTQATIMLEEYEPDEYDQCNDAYLQTSGQSHIMIRVLDKGNGFDVEQFGGNNRGDRGTGLVGVRQRLALIGGRLQIDSKPGKGTCITVQVPDVHDSTEK